MPLLRINATDSGLSLHDMTQPLTPRLRKQAAQPGPAIIMIHGYKYAPGTKSHCPHKKIFGLEAGQWPARLGFCQDTAQEGLCIAFGWYARGALKSVHQRAVSTGLHLATLISLLRAQAPQRPVHIVAHSLGAEIALSALQHLPKAAVQRIILLTGACYASRASAMLATDAGQDTEVLNITSRENDVFDAAFERIIRPATSHDHTIGAGIAASNALTLQIDCDETLNALSSLGVNIALPSRRICHWSAYTRPGVMSLYSRFLRQPDALPWSLLAQSIPTGNAPRWSRLFSRQTAGGNLSKFSLPLRSQSLGLANSLSISASAGRKKHEPAH